MEYREELLWILDKPGSTMEDQEEKFRENIEFVHSLGLKCDSVGWSKLDMADPRTPEILDRIAGFCKEKGWQARCWYTRHWAQENSDWFKLVAPSFKDNTFAQRKNAPGDGPQTYVIRAFHETGAGIKSWGLDQFVPERFRAVCLQNRWEDLDFCWARDIGKYEAEQYFQVYGNRLVPQVAIGEDPDRKVLRTMDGGLPKIAEVFHTLQKISLPDCYLAADMPQGGIASVCYYQTNQQPRLGLGGAKTYRQMRRNTLLIHKDTAQVLLEANVLSRRELQPVPVVEALPTGYTLVKTQLTPRPEGAYMEQLRSSYEALRQVRRPVRAVTEKEALKLLRGAKKERKEEFQKAMPKAKGEALGDSDYSPVAAYYLVANSGWLSEEYQLLPYETALGENSRFQAELEKEELLEEKPQGVVIAKCPDGDAVLLCKDGSVIRFSHEEPVATAQWQSLAQFVAEALNV